MDDLSVRMSYGLTVLSVSSIYVGLIVMLRVTMDSTSEVREGIVGIVSRAKYLYEDMQNSTDSLSRLKYASMALTLYDMILETDGVTRVAIDRLAECDVQRRRRRLKRIVETLVVPTNASVSTTLIT